MEHLDKYTCISHAIRQRRSVYPVAFTDEEVPLSDVKEIIELANWAPTHRKTEPWRYVVCSGAALDELAEAMVTAYRAHVGIESVKDTTIAKIRQKCAMAQHILLVGMHRDRDERLPEWEEIAATAMSVQNLWIALSAAGYGGYWSSPGYAMRLTAYAGWPDGVRCLGLFYVGVPKEGLPDSARGSMSDKVSYRS